MNEIIAKGDWQKQLEWTEKHGTKKEVEMVRRGMGSENARICPEK